MKKTFMACLLLAGLATSCSEDLNVGDNTHTETLSASVTAEQTRAAFQKDGSFYWSDKDEIGVTTSNSDKLFSSMTLKTGAGEASATFEGQISGNIGSYAIYPYSKEHSLDGTKLTYSFPSSYDYSKVDQTYFPSEKNGNSYNPAMWAYIQNNSVSFKHLGGVFMIRIAEMPCASGTLEFTSNQNLCGQYSVDLNAASEPQLVNTQGASSAGKTVTISFKNATVGNPGVFYIPVPTGEYDAWLTLKDGDNNAKLKDVVAGSFTIKRTVLRALTISKKTIDAGVATTAATTEDATTALKSNNNVALTAEVSGETTVSIPEVSSESAAKTLSFSNVAKSAKITVSDANTSASTDASKSVKELTVSIPNINSTTVSDAPSLDVEMPNSSVTIAGNAGVATINQLTASTAKNTLIVSSGVTIAKLNIKQGNVRVNKGATVSLIEADYTTPAVVYYEEGAKVTDSGGTGITLVKIPVGSEIPQLIKQDSDFEAAVNKGGNYALAYDVELTKHYTVATTLDLNLNGKTLETSFYIAAIGGKLTLHDGNIKQHDYADKTKTEERAGLHVGTEGTLIADHVTYTGTGTWQRFYVIECQKTVNLIVRNSTITTGCYGVSTNASTTTGVTNPCNIILEDSKFNCKESGAMINIDATTTMKNCEFSGNHQGALLRGGTYTIEGCTFKLNATLAYSDSEHMWMKAWKDGNCCAYAALTIGNYLNSAYAYKTNVNFVNKKSTTVVEGTNATSFPAVHVCANNYDVTITGFADYLTVPASGCKSPSVEYGTDKITVDGKTPDINTNTTANSETATARKK